eukprot:scaffold18197_cov122-Isochrysis_galbana.AAC.3
MQHATIRGDWPAHHNKTRANLRGLNAKRQPLPPLPRATSQRTRSSPRQPASSAAAAHTRSRRPHCAFCSSRPNMRRRASQVVARRPARA